MSHSPTPCGVSLCFWLLLSQRFSKLPLRCNVLLLSLAIPPHAVLTTPAQPSLHPPPPQKSSQPLTYRENNSLQQSSITNSPTRCLHRNCQERMAGSEAACNACCCQAANFTSGINSLRVNWLLTSFFLSEFGINPACFLLSVQNAGPGACSPSSEATLALPGMNREVNHEKGPGKAACQTEPSPELPGFCLAPCSWVSVLSLDNQEGPLACLKYLFWCLCSAGSTNW